MFFILSRVTARGATVVTVPFLKTTPKASLEIYIRNYAQ